MAATEVDSLQLRQLDRLQGLVTEVWQDCLLEVAVLIGVVEVAQQGARFN